jgi:hypothetical protein
MSWRIVGRLHIILCHSPLLFSSLLYSFCYLFFSFLLFPIFSLTFSTLYYHLLFSPPHFSSLLLFSIIFHLYPFSASAPSMPSLRSLLYELMDWTVLQRTLPYYTVRRLIVLYNLMYHSHPLCLPILRRTYNIACSTYNAPFHSLHSTPLLYSKEHHSTVFCSTPLCTTLLLCTPLFSPLLCSISLYRTVLHRNVLLI